jgi:hypothetical protein
LNSKDNLLLTYENRHIRNELSFFQVKEVTLLGQNVNSYNDLSDESVALFPEVKFDVDKSIVKNAPGFKTVYKPKIGGVRFADLLQVLNNDFHKICYY